MAYRPRFGATTPSRHDHVGQMTFMEDGAKCEGCGDTWALNLSQDQFGKRSGRYVSLGKPNASRGEDWGAW